MGLRPSHAHIDSDDGTLGSPTRHLTILASHVHFSAGPFPKETPPGKDKEDLTPWVDYTF